MCARPANQELRREILTAATRIIEDCGPDCVTMRQVAEEVGYTPTTLYLYFKDKHAILREVVIEGFDDLADFLDAAAVGPTPLDRVRQRTRAYVVWGLLHPGLYQLMLETRIETDFTLEETKRVTRGLVAGGRALSEAIEQGQLTGIEDPYVISSAAWAATHGVTSLVVARRFPDGAVSMSAPQLLEAATRIADALVNSLLAPHLA
jgi:AcrR family transcriptional regulator